MVLLEWLGSTVSAWCVSNQDQAPNGSEVWTLAVLKSGLDRFCSQDSGVSEVRR